MGANGRVVGNTELVVLREYGIIIAGHFFKADHLFAFIKMGALDVQNTTNIVATVDKFLRIYLFRLIALTIH